MSGLWDITLDFQAHWVCFKFCVYETKQKNLTGGPLLVVTVQRESQGLCCAILQLLYPRAPAGNPGIAESLELQFLLAASLSSSLC